MRNVFCVLLTGLLLSCGANQPEKSTDKRWWRGTVQSDCIRQTRFPLAGERELCFYSRCYWTTVISRDLCERGTLGNTIAMGWHSFPNKDNSKPDEA